MPVTFQVVPDSKMRNTNCKKTIHLVRDGYQWVNTAQWQDRQPIRKRMSAMAVHFEQEGYPETIDLYDLFDNEP